MTSDTILALVIAVPVFSVIAYQARKTYVEETVKDEAELRRKQQECDRMQQEAERRQQEYDRNQQLIYDRLTGYISAVDTTLKDLPKMIQVAETSLDEAVTEFADGAFAPFWDAIERVATDIAHFNRGLQQISYLSDSYNKDSNELKSLTAPPFNMNFNLIPSTSNTVNRMRSIVRIAQKDFHFASIYEQRKTNKILIEGFTSLGQAISDMSYRITDSIEALSTSISDLAESNRENSRQLIAGVEALREQLQSDAEARRDNERIEREMLEEIQRRSQSDAKARRDHERKEREMLDNIQRHRKPSIFN